MNHLQQKHHKSVISLNSRCEKSKHSSENGKACKLLKFAKEKENANTFMTFHTVQQIFYDYNAK